MPHGADLSRPLSADNAEAVQRALLRVDGIAFADRTVDALSQGERARLMLARTLATEASVLLADEPVANLDPAYALDTLLILRAEAARGSVVVASLHDLALAARFADRVVVLAEGRVVADDAAAALRPAIIDAAYGVDFRAVAIEGIVHPIAGSRRS